MHALSAALSLTTAKPCQPPRKMMRKKHDNIRLYHVDHLGSTSLVTDIDGEITQHVAYIPYGEVFVEQRNGSWNTPYLFNAKELDEETGLYYYGARYLDPTNAAWLSVDPLFEKYVGMTPYNYCAGNPIKLLDPNGEAIYKYKSEDGSESYIIPTEEQEKKNKQGDKFIYNGRKYVKVSDGNDMSEVYNTPTQNVQAGGAQFYGMGDKVETGYKAKNTDDTMDSSDLNTGFNSLSKEVMDIFKKWGEMLWGKESTQEPIQEEAKPEEPKHVIQTQYKLIECKINRKYSNIDRYDPKYDSVIIRETKDVTEGKVKVIGRDTITRPYIPTQKDLKKWEGMGIKIK